MSLPRNAFSIKCLYVVAKSLINEVIRKVFPKRNETVGLVFFEKTLLPIAHCVSEPVFEGG